LTGTPEIGGFTSAQALQLARTGRAEHRRFHAVEVMPPYDPQGSVTCLLAASIVYEFISLIAVQKRDQK
jgi:agmatinase